MRIFLEPVKSKGRSEERPFSVKNNCDHSYSQEYSPRRRKELEESPKYYLYIFLRDPWRSLRLRGEGRFTSIFGAVIHASAERTFKWTQRDFGIR
jgi:hypothetical protein